MLTSVSFAKSKSLWERLHCTTRCKIDILKLMSKVLWTEQYSHLTFLSQFVVLPGNKWWCLGLELESFLQYFTGENAVCLEASWRCPARLSSVPKACTLPHGAQSQVALPSLRLTGQISFILANTGALWFLLTLGWGKLYCYLVRKLNL